MRTRSNSKYTVSTFQGFRVSGKKRHNKSLGWLRRSLKPCNIKTLKLAGADRSVHPTQMLVRDDRSHVLVLVGGQRYGEVFERRKVSINVGLGVLH